MGKLETQNALKDSIVDTFGSTRRRIGVYFRDTSQLKNLLSQIDGLRDTFWQECKLGSGNKSSWDPIGTKLEAANYELRAVALKSVGL